MSIHTWADGYDVWHARVPDTADAAKVARRAILDELYLREVNLAPSRIGVELDALAAYMAGTVAYREVSR
jgi:hypothetical protein